MKIYLLVFGIDQNAADVVKHDLLPNCYHMYLQKIPVQFSMDFSAEKTHCDSRLTPGQQRGQRHASCSAQRYHTFWRGSSHHSPAVCAAIGAQV